VKEAELLDVDGNVKFINMKSKGLGDTIHKFTTKTGIKNVVDKVSQGLNIPCGCHSRRNAMNMMFPYSKGKNKK